VSNLIDAIILTIGLAAITWAFAWVLDGHEEMNGAVRDEGDNACRP
jgi:hypothetical protein